MKTSAASKSYRWARGLLAALASLAMLCAVPALATSRAPTADPSLEETLGWLAQTINSNCRVEWRAVSNLPKDDGGEQNLEVSCRVVSVSGGVLVVETTSRVETGARRSFGEWRLSVNLSDLDPDGIKVAPIAENARWLSGDRRWNLIVRTTNALPKVSRKYVSTWADTSEPLVLEGMDPSFSIQFPDQETALRVARGLRHAISLSGGKRSANKDLFK